MQFICSGCNQLKRLTNSQLFRNKSKKEQEELNEEEEFSEIYEPVKECGDCFIAKLESMDERDIIRKLVGTLHRENTSDYRLLTTHLKLWGLRNIPVRARED